jgi:glucose-6-phosphate 1-dehydrogenase
VQFKRTPHTLFRAQAATDLNPNQIVMNVQPDEGIQLRFEGKVPGSGMQIRSVEMAFDYCERFNACIPEPYAVLLMDCLRGDQTLFKHRDEVESAWHVVQPILDYWQSTPPTDFPNYPAGTWGPDSADTLLSQAGRRWHNEA